MAMAVRKAASAATDSAGFVEKDRGAEAVEFGVEPALTRLRGFAMTASMVASAASISPFSASASANRHKLRVCRAHPHVRATNNRAPHFGEAALPFA